MRQLNFSNVGLGVFAGSGNDGSDADISLMVAQPFINYNYGGGWYMTTQPIITANWEADNSATVTSGPFRSAVVWAGFSTGASRRSTPGWPITTTWKNRSLALNGIFN